MKYNTLFSLLALCFVTVVFSQSQKEPDYVKINWKVGTEKTVHVADTMLIYNDNELFSSTYSKSAYKLKVLSLKDTVYEVRVKYLNYSSDVTLGDDLGEYQEVFDQVMNVITKFEKAVTSFDFVVLLDKNSGFAYEIKNEKQFSKMMEKLVQNLVLELVGIFEGKLDSKKRMELEEMMKMELNNKSEAIIQTVLNSINYTTQIYSYPYILNETYYFDTQVSDIDQINHGDDEYDVKIEVRASMDKDKLVHNSILHYDKNAVYEELKRKSDDPDFVSISEFALFEEIVTKIDLKTSWITSSRSVSDVILGDIQVKSITNVVFQ